MAAKQIFSSEAISDAAEHESLLFSISSMTGQPSHIAFQIGNEESSAGDDNTIAVTLKISPDYGLVLDKTDAIWITVPQSIFVGVYLFVGANYQEIGAIDSGDEHFSVQEMFGNFPYAKLVAQRGQIGGTGTNTITMNAWVF
jgi:hypothetical protein